MARSPLALPTIVRMIDILSSTLVTARYTWQKACTPAPRVQWPDAFTAMVRAGARNSARQVILSADPAKVARSPVRSPNTARPPEERSNKGSHKRRRPARRPAVQAYRVWSKRKQISRRHAVKLQGAIHMEEIIPAPLEEVFLMEEILPAPLQEFEANSPLGHTKAKNSLRLPEPIPPVLTGNDYCGHSEPRSDHPSPHSCRPHMSVFCRGLNASSHVWNPVPCAPTHWQYIGHPFQFVDACATQSTFHWQPKARREPEAPVLEFGAPVPSLLTSALADTSDLSLALPSGQQSCSSLAGPEFGGGNFFLAGGTEHEGVRGPLFVEYTPVPGAFVDESEDSDNEIEFVL